MLLQQTINLVAVPTIVAEFYGVGVLSRQELEKIAQSAYVRLPLRRKLKKHGPKVRTQVPGARKEKIDRFFGVLQSFDMGEETAGFYCEQKA